MTGHPGDAGRMPLVLMARVFLPFALGYFVSYFYRVVNAVLESRFVDELALDAGSLGLLTSAYFLTFAAFQLPLGVLLDRYGPRLVNAGLLLVAAAGAALFAVSGGLGGLIAGRALIGLGVSACLMAGFKTFVLWFPPQKLPLVNGLQLGAGGLGALAATVPVEVALQVTDWRGVFVALAVLTLLTSALIFLAVPERRDGGHHLTLGEQLRGTAAVFSSPFFWRLVPWTVVSQGATLAIQGLWVGPWLRDVAGLDPMLRATWLAAVLAALLAGYVLTGAVAERLGRLGVGSMTVATWGMGVFMVVQVGIIAGITELALPLWMLFTFFGTSGVISYAVLSQRFPGSVSGRVTTALNMLVFVAAFALQWGIGAIVDLWPTTATGYDPAGYQAAFTFVLALQVAGLAWFHIAPRLMDTEVALPGGSRAREAVKR